MTTQTRNLSAGIQPAAAQEATAPPRVGGRHHAARPPPQGGGYLPSCNSSEALVSARAAAAADPRIEELRQLGLRPIWILAAAAIGFEAFIAQWQVFSENEDKLDGRNRVTLPTIDTYRRFQRDQVIRTLAQSGKTAREICEELHHVHGFPETVERVRKLVAKMLA